ncbi:MAG: ChrR family anti-sigma-E factor [Gammaproteobacteria bacterium]|nr:ChrR family anti-sigma-E factor [Gammaproteobacteria bacterium]
MPKYHPDTHWLVDYAAGNIEQSHALCINVHLEHCPQCRAKSRQLAAIGASFMNDSQQQDTAMPDAPAGASSIDVGETATLDSVLAKIDLLESEPKAAPQNMVVNTAAANNEVATNHAVGTNNAASYAAPRDLPASVAKLLQGGWQSLRWKKLGRTLRVATLECGDTQREVALHRLRAGGSVANHDHGGDEVTVVLRGSFSDQQGLYLPGDFLLRKQGEQHRPVASGDTECLCLSVVDAPIKFTGFFTQLLNPFIKIHPSTA